MIVNRFVIPSSINFQQEFFMTFRIAAVQMNTQDDKDKNLETAERLIDEAASMGANMVGLPEMFNILG
ncbi:MAG: nitrilase-related carbon-nitrogen hydrolase, partial [Chloroflexota bacterium]